MAQYIGRLKVINLAGQKVIKQNMAIRGKGRTVKGINWLNIGQTESQAGLHGTLSAESRFVISSLSIEHVVPDAEDEKPTLDIYGRMFIPQGIKIGSDMMIDLALVISFSRFDPRSFGLLLGCPVETHDRRGTGGTMYFLFAPRCSEAEFSAQIPATARVFPKLPGRMHMSLGLARATLEYRERFQTYMTTSFSATKLLNFPTVSLRDLKRIRTPG